MLAQCAPSTAAPQAATPPPQMRRSVSTVTVSNAAIFVSLLGVFPARESTRCKRRHARLEPKNLIHLDRALLGVQAGRLAHQRRALQVVIARRVVTERLRLPLRGGANRELEALQRAVAELDRPHDRVTRPKRNRTCTQRNEVGVAANLDRLYGADLDAAVALPALLRLLVVGLHLLTIQGHEIVRTNVLASRLIKCFATVTFVCYYETGHQISFPQLAVNDIQASASLFLLSSFPGRVTVKLHFDFLRQSTVVLAENIEYFLPAEFGRNVAPFRKGLPKRCPAQHDTILLAVWTGLHRRHVAALAAVERPIDRQHLALQSTLPQIVIGLLRIEGPVVVAHSRMVAPDNHVRATEVLTEEAMKQTFTRPGIAHIQRVAAHDHSLFIEVILEKCVDALHANIGRDITRFEFPHQLVNVQAIANLDRYLRQILMRAVHGITKL